MTAFALLAFALGAQSGAPADLVLTGARVYTLDPAKPRAEAVAVRDGEIVFVGSDAAAQAYVGPKTRVVALFGKAVYPGMTDSHFHITGVGQREMELNLEGTTTKQAFLDMVAERVKSAKPGDWIVGRGWIETFWSPPEFPSAKDLDAIAPNNPVYLRRADGHAAVANTLAIKAAGVTSATPDPSGGAIHKDPQSGAPTGMFIDAAMGLFSRVLPQQDAAYYRKADLEGAAFAARHGWTQVQVAGGGWTGVERLRALYREGLIPIRIYQALSGPGPDADRLIQQGPSIGEFGGLFTVRGIKCVADGALGSRGAYLLEKYADADTRGLITVSEKAMKEMLPRAMRAGIQVETHAIGDAANRSVLDWYEEAYRSVPQANQRFANPRWRIEHAQNLAASDIPRFAEIGIIASMQPSHAISDLHFAPRRLGPERLAGAYAWKRILASGAIICAGSDAPVERGDPRIEFYAAVARKDLKGFSGEGWHPEYAVTREEALKMLTLWPATAAFEENTRGSIVVGKRGDFTVFDLDLMQIPLDKIMDAKCVLTVVDGKVAYNRT